MNLLANRAYLIMLMLVFCTWGGAAHAARVLTSAQSPSGASAVFSMGSIQTLNYTLTNNNTGADVGTNYYAVSFALGASGTVYTSRPVAPAGWYVSSYSTTSVTFRVSTNASAIALGQSVVFSLALAMGTSAADAAESFASIQGYYTNPPKNNKKTNASSTGSWTRKSLAITSFQITDTLGNPITAITAGSSFQLRMTVKNNSSATQSSVVSNNNPPAATKTGTVTQALTGTSGSPLSLAAGASGTIIFTYSTVLTDSGTISFTAIAQNGGTVTSASATSTTLAVSKFNASVAASSSCLYSGSPLTVTMTIVNNTGSTITAISGSLTPALGAPVTYVSGPTPASVASLATGSSTVMTWTYVANATGATNPFTFSGSASGTSGSTLTTPTATTSNITRGLFTVVSDVITTNASSTNQQIGFNVVNSGCANVSSVAVTPATGWVFSGDSYSLVNLSAASSIETWTASGTSPVTFLSPNSAGQIPITFSGEFFLVFSTTPAAATTSVFSLRVTDSTGAFVDVPVSIVVNAYKSGVLNNSSSKSWREDFR